MVFIIKCLGIMVEIILMAVAILLLPVQFVINLYYHIRYGVEMNNAFAEIIDVIKTLFGYCKDLVHCA